MALALHDLAGDPAFLRLSSAAYVRSLAADPLLEPARVESLRREAFGTGCRARGLLSDMARGGANDALAALDTCDPAEKRLIEALRAEGAEALSRFLDEEDAATASQSSEAAAELASRGGTVPSSKTAIDRVRFASCRPAPRGVLARLAMEVLAEAREGAATQVPEGAFGPRFDAALRAFRATLRPESSFPRVFYHALPWTNQAVVISLPPDPEFDEIVSILSNSPRSPAAWGRLVELARTRAEKHPLDLRWVVAQNMKAALPVPTELLDRIRTSCTRNAAFLATARKGEKRADVQRRDIDRVLELRKDDAVGPLMTELGLAYFGNAGMDEVAREVVPTLRARCRGDRDLLLLYQSARNAKVSDLAKELRTRLEVSDDPIVRKEAILDAWREDKRPVEKFMDWVRWEGWPEHQATQLWEMALGAASNEEKHGVALQVYAEMWEAGLVDDIREGICDLNEYGSEGFREAAARRIEQGEAPAWAHFALLATTHYGGASEQPEAESVQALRDASLLRRWIWNDSLEEMPTDRRRREWQALVASLPRGAAALALREPIERMASHLVTETDASEAVALAEAWADRCGDVPLSEDERPWSYVGMHGMDAFPLAEDPRTLPRRALAAAVLDATHYSSSGIVCADAFRLYREAASQAADPLIREACLYRAAYVMVDARMNEEVLPLLLELRRHSTVAEVRSWADGSVASALAEKPGLAPRCVDTLLQDAERMPPPPPEQVLEAERSLASDDSAQREAATEALRRRGAEALPLLRALHGSADPEVRARVEALLTDLVLPR